MADNDLQKPAMPTDIPAKKPDRDAVIEQWFLDHMHASPVSQNTLVFNHVRAAVDDLKKRLKGD